jgi:hypothetical protein
MIRLLVVGILITSFGGVLGMVLQDLNLGLQVGM